MDDIKRTLYETDDKVIRGSEHYANTKSMHWCAKDTLEHKLQFTGEENSLVGASSFSSMQNKMTSGYGKLTCYKCFDRVVEARTQSHSYTRQWQYRSCSVPTPPNKQSLAERVLQYLARGGTFFT